MKPFVTLALFVTLLTGCAIKIGSGGFSAVPITPPPDATVGISVSSIGINLSENPATQMPHAVIGWKRIQYNRIAPVATNTYLPSIRSKIGVNQSGLASGIDETFETGDAAKQTQTNGIMERLFSK